MDIKEKYAAYKGMKLITQYEKETQMAIVSSLLATMAFKKESDKNLLKVILYSAVIIRAKKDKLNYKLAYKDLGIDKFAKKYLTKLEKELYLL